MKNLTAVQAVVRVLSSGGRLTGPEIREEVYGLTDRYYSESGITARLREARGEKFGKHIIVCELNNGRYEYSLVKEK